MIPRLLPAGGCVVVCFAVVVAPARAQLHLDLPANFLVQNPAPEVPTPSEPAAVESPPPTRRGPSPLLQSLYGATILVQALDAHSTLRGLSAGGVEVNPVIQPFADHHLLLVAFRGGVAASMIYGTHSMARKHKVAAVLINIGVNCAYGAIIAHNHKVGSVLRAERH